MSVKDKILAVLITIAILGFFLALGWLTKTGGFGVMADVIKNPEILSK
jgi:hypothetical protein